MIVTLNWLKKHLSEFEINDIESFRHKVDTRLTEVEDIIVKGQGIKGLQTAEILKVVEHPTINKLKVCDVSTGDNEIISVVCGATNAREGLKTIYCSVGGTIINPTTKEKVTIEKKEIAEVESTGMLCSSAELGLNQFHEKIVELPQETPLGMPIDNLLKDIVLEIQNKSIPHRPDCFSHLGIAREFSSILKSELNNEEESVNLKVNEVENPLKLKVNIKDKEGCNRFSSLIIRNVEIKPSPFWLQVQLAYSGVRPVNNIVDITNYIMLDLGQPMHAFDYDKLDGTSLTVRKAFRKEKMVTLDNVERELDESITVIADNSGAQAIAGIMGGQSTEISEDTKNIVLEAANWEMYQIRRASRKLGLRSEASTRYEKGFSPSISLNALKKATRMIIDLAGGDIASEIVDIYPEPQENRIVKFSPKLVKQRIGLELDKAAIIKILELLNFEIINKNQIPADAIAREEINVEFEIKIPLYRMDIKAEEDILEEIARMYGYENIPTSLPTRDIMPATGNRKEMLIRKLKKSMAKAGFTEILTYPMIGKSLCEKAEIDTSELIGIKNAISPELDYVRNEITSSLLSRINPNLVAGYSEFGMFEIDRVAIKGKSDENGLPKQIYKMSAIFIADEKEKSLRHIQTALELVGVELKKLIKIDQNTEISSKYKYLHPYQSGTLVSNPDNEVIGAIGFTHQKINENFDASNKYVCTFEIHDLDRLLDESVAENRVIPFSEISEYVTSTRDISFWINDDVSIGNILELINQKEITELLHADLIDIYNSNEDGRRSITIRLYLQSNNRTLEGEEINEIVETVVTAIKQKSNAEFRSS